MIKIIINSKPFIGIGNSKQQAEQDGAQKLLEGNNIGKYNNKKLDKMIELCKKYNLISKEHNGDWVNIDLIKEKFDRGLNSINIAPELGEIETKVILNEIKKINDIEKQKKLFNNFYKLCYESKKWVKWVSKDFNPEENKEKLINICGHYIFSCPGFEDIKKNLINIDKQIKKYILIKLREYHSLYDSYYKVIITTSGIGSRLGNITKYTNKALIKIGDKLSICHIIEKYNKYLEFVITLGYFGNFVKDFLELAYPEHYFNFIFIDKYQGEGSSLAYSLLQAKCFLNCPFMFNCCDSLTKDKIIIPSKNTLFVNNNNNSTLYSTINITNTEYVKKINKKGEIKFDFVYTGIAFIKNYKEYWNILENIILDNNDYGDVEIIDKMLYNYKFKYTILNEWFDSGNLTEINNKIKSKYSSKYIVIDKHDESISFFDKYVIKFFYNKTVCQNRIIRGKYLYPLTPNIIDYKDNFIKMELIDGELVSNIKTHGEIKNLLNWSMKNLWTNTQYNTENFKNICYKFYIDKTNERINKILQTNINDNLSVNNLNIGTIHNLLKKINFENILIDTYSNYHGDFILDNIIKTNNSYKLLDWRQDFGGELYNGDKYYDLAKLRHNIIFNHNNIRNNLYNLDIKNNNVNIELKCNYTLINQLKDFDNFIYKNNLDLIKIKILTSLIWLNMAPLYDYPLNEFLFYFGKYNLYLEIK